MTYKSYTLALNLLHEISKHIRISFLKERPRISGEDSVLLPTQSAYSFTCAFYGNEALPTVARERGSTSPLVTVFDDLVRLSMLGSIPAEGLAPSSAIRENFVQSLLLFKKMAQQLQSSDEKSVSISWSTSEWLTAVLQPIKNEVFVSIYSSMYKPTVTRSGYSVSGPGQCGLYGYSFARGYLYGT